MRRTFSPAFLATTAILHATMIAVAGLGAGAAPAAASAARWAVALIYVGSVVYLALRPEAEWPTDALMAPPAALGLGLVLGAIVLQVGWGERPGSPLLVLTACALPAVAAAVFAPAVGALMRRAFLPEETSP